MANPTPPGTVDGMDVDLFDVGFRAYDTKQKKKIK